MDSAMEEEDATKGEHVEGAIDCAPKGEQMDSELKEE